MNGPQQSTSPSYPPFPLTDILVGTWPVQISRLATGCGTSAAAAAFSLDYPNGIPSGYTYNGVTGPTGDLGRGTGSQQAGILGGGSTIPATINSYGGRDICVLNAQVNAPARFGGSSGTSSTVYTSTAVQSPTWTVDLARVVVGMLIDTLHSPKWTGQVTAVNISTGVISVSAWYQHGAANGTTGTPANGTDCIINPVSQTYGGNIVNWFYPFSDPLPIDGTSPPSSSAHPGPFGYGLEFDVGNELSSNVVYQGARFVEASTDFATGNSARLAGFSALASGSSAIDISGLYPCGIQMSFLPGGGSANYLYFAGNLGTQYTATAWNSGTAYVATNIITFQNNYYVCILGNTNEQPPNATYWTSLGPVVALQVDTNGYLTVSGKLTTQVALNLADAAQAYTTTPTGGAVGDIVADVSNNKIWMKCSGGWKAASLS